MRLFALKLFLDGTFTSRTAWMLTPYKEGGTGLNVLEPAELDRRMRQAADLGLATAVHVIGDRAVRELLDATERFRREHPDASLRMRAEHAQLVDPADVPRFRALEVAASVQPAHLVPDFPVLLEHFPRRAACAYPFRALLDARAPLCLSSDAPIMPADIGQCLHAAVNRSPWPAEAGSNQGWHPEQSLTVAEVLSLYAEGAARAEGLERRRGRIAAGFDADLTVFTRDPRGLEPGQLLHVQAAGTVCGGVASNGL